MLIALLIIASSAYAASALLVLRQLANGNTTSTMSVKILPWVAIVSHVYILWLQLKADHFDHLNMATSFSVVAALLAVFSTIRGTRPGSLLLRPVIYLFAALGVVLVIIAPVDWGATLSSRNGLIVHIVLSLVAYGVLVLATLYAIQLLYLTRVLKQRRANALARYLPPLMSVEHYFFRLLAAGTLLLITALLTGFIFLDDMLTQGQAHKTILSMLAAALYAALVIAHKFRGVRGKFIVVGSIVASIILTLAYFGSRFVKDVILSI